MSVPAVLMLCRHCDATAAPDITSDKAGDGTVTVFRCGRCATQIAWLWSSTRGSLDIGIDPPGGDMDLFTESFTEIHHQGCDGIEWPLDPHEGA